MGHFGLSLGKTVYSILPQSTQLKNRYLALIRQCLELVRYMASSLNCFKWVFKVKCGGSCTGPTKVSGARSGLRGRRPSGIP